MFFIVLHSFTMQKVISISTIIMVILSSLIYLSELALSIILLGILSAITVVCGITCVIWIHIKLSSTHSTGLMVRPILAELDRFRDRLLVNVQEPQKTEPLPIILGRTLDILLQQIIDLTLRDFVNYYLKNLVFQPKKLCDTFKEDIWSAFSCFHERLLRIDRSKLLACDMVIKITQHFEKIREITTNRPDNKIFRISPYLVSKETELDYLKQVSELLIMFLLPRSYSLPPAKYFYRDILTVKVLYTTIDTITDPDYINQSIKTYIESTHLNTIFINKRQFESTNSYEEFIKMIQKSDDIAFIKGKRFYIVTKLMEATTILNIKRTKGIDVDAEKVTSGVSKAELNTIKKLKRWMDQLVAAKRECETRLSELGSDCGIHHQVLPLSVILDHVTGRKYLSQFLEEMASSGLIGYWSSVEELKTVQRKNWHHLGAQIYYTYIKNPTIEIKVDKITKKRMEAFLLGNKGPEVFYEIQKQVMQLLEDKYYHQFINSKYYQNMVTAMDTPESEVDKNSANLLTERQGSGESTGSFDSNLYIGDHSNYSKRKLHELEEKLVNKLQALQAMRISLKPDSRVLTYLEKEVTALQGGKRQLEAHLTRTETWGENLGKWRAVVQSAEITEEKEPPTFVVIVEMDECAEETGDEISSGWVVSRTLAQFQELHRKLRPLCSNFKHVELPSQSFKFLFGKPDKNALDKAKMQVQKYLEFVLNEDRLNQSEAIYAFLSPSADHLKETSTSPKKTKFSLSTIFKSNNITELGTKDTLPFLKEHEDEDLSYYLDTPGDNIDCRPAIFSRNNPDESKDSIALPLYGLMGEIFNKSGVLQFVRKTLITFVQATYNRSINRQIHDTIAYCFSESMLHYYFTLLLKSFWPGGELYKPIAERTQTERQETEQESRALFLATVPDFFRQLVGTNAAKEGAQKIFDTLQQKRMNKQLFYDLLELFLCEVFPEIATRDFGDDSVVEDLN